MALREVNLVPDSFLFRKNLSRHLSLWTILLVLSIGSLSVFHLYRLNASHSKKPPINFLIDKPEQIGFKIEEMRRLKDEIVRFNRQKSGLENVIRNPVYSMVLSKLVEVISDHTWITQLTIENNKEAKAESHMILIGYAGNSAELGDFIENLAENPLFYDVFLNNANEAMLKESEYQVNDLPNLIEFHLECKIRG